MRRIGENKEPPPEASRRPTPPFRASYRLRGLFVEQRPNNLGRYSSDDGTRQAGTRPVTTAPAATTAPSSMTAPRRIVAPARDPDIVPDDRFFLDLRPSKLVGRE
ncbi:hypothetical protein D3H35_00975 [Cohnella faecalis]|uniref:Uncharacterized protein n=1 Tax=Cohnella faecalis TaxID=2315694 RepID=A0A398CVP9_9BACL|nr:hypothetical protein D3H35_00975 [Cohnella faecalis]